LFALFDKAEEDSYKVAAIHNEGGYRKVRSLLARQYDVGTADPNIQVVGAALKGDRTLFLTHRMNRGVPLHDASEGTRRLATSSGCGATTSFSKKRRIDARAFRSTSPGVAQSATRIRADGPSALTNCVTAGLDPGR